MNQKVNELRELYPVGTRIECIQIGEDPRPIESGMKGTVDHVDGAGIVHVFWDNGRVLGLIPDVDEFRIV